MSVMEWNRLRAPQLRALAQEDCLVILPVGSTEQHGPHLPVQVDIRLPEQDVSDLPEPFQAQAMLG